MIYRGTTPTLRFRMKKLDPAEITWAQLTLRQASGFSLQKSLADCTVAEEYLSVTLSEAETLAMRGGEDLRFQLRIAVGEVRMATDHYREMVGRLLEEGVRNG